MAEGMRNEPGRLKGGSEGLILDAALMTTEEIWRKESRQEVTGVIMRDEKEPDTKEELL